MPVSGLVSDATAKSVAGVTGVMGREIGQAVRLLQDDVGTARHQHLAGELAVLGEPAQVGVDRGAVVGRLRGGRDGGCQCEGNKKAGKPDHSRNIGKHRGPRRPG